MNSTTDTSAQFGVTRLGNQMEHERETKGMLGDDGEVNGEEHGA